MKKNKDLGIFCHIPTLGGISTYNLRKELFEETGFLVKYVRKSDVKALGFYENLYGLHYLYGVENFESMQKVLKIVEQYGGYGVCIYQAGSYLTLGKGQLLRSLSIPFVLGLLINATFSNLFLNKFFLNLVSKKKCQQ